MSDTQFRKLDTCAVMLILTFNRPVQYLNLSTWFMKNILFEEKKTKLWNKQYWSENNAQMMKHILKIE
jgi:hypothetical protein